MIALPADIQAHINDGDYVATELIELQGAITHRFTSYSQDLVWPATTVAASVASGSHAVTPATMAGIAVGMTLTVLNIDGTNSEAVVVTAVTSTTFTATFASSKASGWIMRGPTWLHNAPFTISQIVSDANGIQDVTITFDSQNRVIQGFDQNEGISDRVIRVHEAWVDTRDGVTVYANGVMTDIANGTTSGIDFDETGSNSTATMNLGSASAMTSQNGPRNVYGLSCVNGFGDKRCKIVPANTTVALAVATGSHVVTPAAMTSIFVGISLNVANADGSNGETVAVTAVTGTTFTANFVLAKSAGWTVHGRCRKTFADCTAYANTQNFRGVRHALTPPFTVIWGQTSVVVSARIFPGQVNGTP